jgi:16S rRNA (guanine(527)-N(7))-methyltransferase RsmG
MTPARIAELLDPFLGPADQRPNTQNLLQRISTYIDLLRRWNARVNLTAIRDEEQIVTRHFGESLFAARRLFPVNKNGPGMPHFWPILPEVGISTKASEPATEEEFGAPEKESLADNRERAALQGRVDALKGKGALAPTASEDRRPNTDARVTVVDIGSGAGFPGIPIKLWAPGIYLTLIESNHKKATFLREIARALTLTDINIQTARAESLGGSLFDVVTLRAVERFESVLPVAAALVAPAGRLALLIGQSQLSPTQSALPNLTWSSLDPIPNSNSRVLAIATRPVESRSEPKQ